MRDLVEPLLYVLRSIWLEPSNRGERSKRIVMFIGWQIWKRVIRLPLIVPTDNGFRFIAYPDSDVAAGFLYYRVPGSQDIEFLRAHVNGGIVVDVGSNVGSVSLLIADKIGRAILFDANPVAAARARENVGINQLPFEVHELAVSDDQGTVEFEDIGGGNSCNRTVVGFETKVPTRTVRRIALDDFLDGQGVSSEISLIKIDVEGHENAVIRGMKRLLQAKRVRLVMFEYLQRTNLQEAIANFEAAGYKVFELTPNGPAELQGFVRPLQNLFACPKEIFPMLGMPT